MLISGHFVAARGDFFGGRCARLCQGSVVARPKCRASPKLEERRRAVTAKGCAALTAQRPPPLVAASGRVGTI